MKLPALTRKVHYWLAIAAALPVALIVATGLLLQLKKQIRWVQPPERRAAERAHRLSLPEVLAICRAVPQAGIREWSDVHRVDVRPSRHMLKVTSNSRWEIQIDTHSGDVLQVAYRRSDLIESLHDGSWFSDPVKYGVFLPAGVILFLLWGTGLYLFVLPFALKARRGRRSSG